jgi:SAM-dependent methyltransferase
VDPHKFSTIAHHERDLLGPVSFETVDALFSRIEFSPPPHDAARVLDVGCGKGELLLRAMQIFGALGVGVEPNPSFAAVAMTRARQRGLHERLTLRQLPFDHASIPHGRFDLGICTGATHAFGGLRPALARLAQLVRTRGWALVGEGYWRRPPEPGYLEVLGARPDELQTHAANQDAALAAGWRVDHAVESTPEEFDAYEDSYAASMHRWLAARPQDPDAPAFRARIERWQDGYRRWGRETLGFGLYLLRH